MAKIANFKGGSTGYEAIDTQNNESYASDRLNAFVEGIPSLTLKKDSTLTGYILPAFNPNLSENDAKFKTSVGSYRDERYKDDNGDGKFTNWFYTVAGYDFFGKMNSTFISPTTFGEDDPIIDLRKYIYTRRKKNNDTTYFYLVNKEAYTFPDKELLQSSRNLHLLNVYSTGTTEEDKGFKNRILVLKKYAMDRLMSDLNESRKKTIPVIDPAWEDYTLGDITNPEHALKFKVQTYEGNGQNTPSWPGLFLGNPKSGAGISPASIPVEALEGRFVLDDDTTLKLYSYDDIVMLLLKEGLPYELAERVCKDKCANFPGPNDYELIQERTKNDQDDSQPSKAAPAKSAMQSKMDQYNQETAAQAPAPVTSAPAPAAPAPAPAPTPEAPAAAPAPAPAPAPVTAAAPVVNTGELAPLTPEEDARRKELFVKRFDSSLTTEETVELGNLQTRFNANK